MYLDRGTGRTAAIAMAKLAGRTSFHGPDRVGLSKYFDFCSFSSDGRRLIKKSYQYCFSQPR